MNDTPPTSRWNNENDPRGEKRRFLIKAEHLKAYQRTWNQFDKGLKKLKDSMRDNARKADWIQNEKLKELARTIQRSEDKETTGASRVAMTQISEDVALEILQNEDRGSSVEPIIAATIETLGSRHGIVRPWTDTTSATPANALEAPLHSIESDLAASSPAVSGTLKTPAASHSTTKDISQDMAILAETAKTPCPTCGMSKHSSDSVALPAKQGRILQYGDRMKGTPPRKKRSQSNRYTTQEDEQSPEVVAFEIRERFQLTQWTPDGQSHRQHSTRNCSCEAPFE
ncbi:hypothetical protein ACEPPN_007581 [Leptodophora sp. 'Broadleaf-Isolate-01']